MQYRKISKIFNDEGLQTPRNTPFTPSKVFSIYQKGKVREERINRKDLSKDCFINDINRLISDSYIIKKCTFTRYIQ